MEVAVLKSELELELAHVAAYIWAAGDMASAEAALDEARAAGREKHAVLEYAKTVYTLRQITKAAESVGIDLDAVFLKGEAVHARFKPPADGPDGPDGPGGHHHHHHHH